MKNLKSYISRLLGKYLLFDIKDALAIQYLAPLSKHYLPWTGYSMRPSGLVKILNEIIINRRTQILECGGGISTIYIATLLKNQGGHLYTIEHDKQWAEILKKMIETQYLSEVVSVITAPLSKSKLALNETPWYDETIIQSCLSGVEIDLLVVDGPYARTKDTMYARYPAVPFFKAYMADNFTIILDDIDRVGEQEILLKWEQYLKIRFGRYILDGNIAIGHSKKVFTIV